MVLVPVDPTHDEALTVDQQDTVADVHLPGANAAAFIIYGAARRVMEGEHEGIEVGSLGGPLVGIG
jgi:hypothetical protein